MRASVAVMLWLALAAGASADEPWKWIPATAKSVIRVAPAERWRAACKEFAGGVRASIVNLNRGGLGFFDGLSPGDWLYRSILLDTQIVGGRAGHLLTEFVSESAPTYYVTFAPAPGAKHAGSVMFFKTNSDDVFDAVAKAGGAQANAEREKLDGGWERIAFAGEKLLVTKRGEWGVIATSEAGRAALVAGDLQPHTLATLDEETRRLLTAGDLAWWYNLSLEGDDRAAWQAQHRDMRSAVASLPERAFGSPGAAEATRGLYTALVDAGFQTLNETRWISLSATFTADGVAIESLLRLVDGAAVQHWLPPASASSMELLDELPAGAPLYASASFDVQAFDAAVIAAHTPADEGVRKRVGEFWKSLQACGLGEAASAIWLPAPVTGFEVVAYQRAEKPAALLAAMRTLLHEPAEVETGAGAATAVLQADAETYAGRKIDHVTAKSRLALSDERSLLGGVFSEYLKNLKLGEEYHVRLAAHDDRLLQAVGPTPAMMERAIDTVDSKRPTLGQGRSYGLLRERLHNEAHFVGLMDSPAVVLGLVRSHYQEDELPKALPSFHLDDLPPTYCGLSLAVETSGVRVKAFIPVEQFGGVFSMLPK